VRSPRSRGGVAGLRTSFSALLAFAVACHHDCIEVASCLPLTAISIAVTSAATHAPLHGVTVVVNGDTLHAIPCNGNCRVSGGAGVYSLLFTATGFQSIERTVTVTEGSPVDVSGPEGFEGRSCGCATVNEQSITIELVSTT
jgi:hypothetical protein